VFHCASALCQIRLIDCSALAPPINILLHQTAPSTLIGRACCSPTSTMSQIYELHSGSGTDFIPCLAEMATLGLSKKLVVGCRPTHKLSASLTSFTRVYGLIFLIDDEVAAAISPTNNTESSPSYAVAVFFLSLARQYVAFLCGYFSQSTIAGSILLQATASSCF
jgi:hypothetical protein